MACFFDSLNIVQIISSFLYVYVCSGLLFIRTVFTGPKILKIFSYILEVFFVLPLSFRSMIHLDPFANGVRLGSRLIFFHMDAQLTHCFLLKRASFSPCIIVTPLSSVE